MDCKNTIKQRLKEHNEILQFIENDDLLQQKINQAVTAIIHCFKTGHKVYFCGNGGSAADAQHLAAEFSGKFYMDREVLPA